jgi:Subtilase family
MLVGATGPNGHITSYSSSLLGVTLHAPGGEAAGGTCDATSCILTTDRDGAYRAVQGTSFAVPHVSGVLAQLVALGYSPLAAEARVLTSADLSGGFRKLDAASAVQADPGMGAGPAASGLPGIGEVTLPALTRIIGLGTGSPSSSAAPAAAPAPAPASAAPQTAGGTPETTTVPSAPAAAPLALPALEGQPPAMSAGSVAPAGAPAAAALDVVAGPDPALAGPVHASPGHGITPAALGVPALLLLLMVVGLGVRSVRLARVRPTGPDPLAATSERPPSG